VLLGGPTLISFKMISSIPAVATRTTLAIREGLFNRHHLPKALAFRIQPLI
jgi:hypothetical protein